MTSPWPMGWQTVSSNRFKNIIHIHRIIVIKNLKVYQADELFDRADDSSIHLREASYRVPALFGTTSIFKLQCKTSIHVLCGFLKYLVDVIPWKYGENLEEIPNASSIQSLCFFQLCLLTYRSFLNSASRNLFTVGSSTRKTAITMTTKTNFWNEQPT